MPSSALPIAKSNSIIWFSQNNILAQMKGIIWGGGVAGRAGGKISDLPKLSRYKPSKTGIRKFFGQNKISFDHDWTNCIVYLILLVILTDFSALGS